MHWIDPRSTEHNYACFHKVTDHVDKCIDADVIFGGKRFALCYRSVVCPVCLPVTLVYCGQTVGRIKMKLGMQAGSALATLC